ncbi:trafficking protein particle complex subunit 6A, putative [Babesia microti strain RI]|uniref:Trafficking protein particle complex subunit 6A, putative n=1 Tax=Babesia microti (strain RI) TaxID=1133968 RepID=A0A1R4AC14_BABMR|nr:trafficking protein particle complex subunit 6A, putative [Babesia microti strain RI]SJK86538.1 trafficking protein particle complex subunit 6A, putative [Babesia microti strain RI]|eukprot:XP_021338684.1 trafficking protein particle complex subunit 6A, putative [Babesia microti strain RI]
MDDVLGVSRSLSLHMVNQIVQYNIAKCSEGKCLNQLFLSNLLQELDFQGHLLGNHIAHRLTISSSSVWDDKRGLVFLCKNVWPFLFQKQADKLQANGKGTYIIKDSNIPWISNITVKFINSNNASDMKLRSRMLIQSYQALISGILRGVLDSLGIYSTVDPQQDDPDSLTCTFKVSIKKTSE